MSGFGQGVEDIYIGVDSQSGGDEAQPISEVPWVVDAARGSAWCGHLTQALHASAHLLLTTVENIHGANVPSACASVQALDYKPWRTL